MAEEKDIGTKILGAILPPSGPAKKEYHWVTKGGALVGMDENPRKTWNRQKEEEERKASYAEEDATRRENATGPQEWMLEDPPDELGPISEGMLLAVKWPEEARTSKEKMDWLRGEAVKRAMGKQVPTE